MVVDDSPALGEVAEDEGEEALLFGAVGEGEVPVAPAGGGVLAEGEDGQVGEVEVAHVRRVGSVDAAIAIHGGLPTAQLILGAEEDQVGGVPVGLHEGVEVAAVPGVALQVEYVADGGGWRRLGGERQQQQTDDEKATAWAHGAGW